MKCCNFTGVTDNINIDVFFKVLKKHEVGDVIGTSGQWQIHAAYCKSPPGECSVWIHDRKAVRDDKTLTKKQKETLNEVLKRDAQILTRMKHPQMLKVTQALDESKDYLAFAVLPPPPPPHFLLLYVN